MASKEASVDSFRDAVDFLRERYEILRKHSNLCPPKGKLAIDVQSDRVDGCDVQTCCFEDGQCVHLADTPGTLSGNILRLLQDLPSIDDSFEI
jgi:hypothetical protein